MTKTRQTSESKSAQQSQRAKVTHREQIHSEFVQSESVPERLTESNIKFGLANRNLSGIQRQVIVGHIGNMQGNRCLQKKLKPACSNTLPFGTRRRNIVQRWESPEHIELGDKSGGPKTGRITLNCHDDFTWNDDWKAFWNKNEKGKSAKVRREMWNAMTKGLTYGQIVALSGDFFKGFRDLQNASLMEIIRLIPIIMDKEPNLAEAQKITGGRYLDLAENNISHFSNVAADFRNMTIWKREHLKAIRFAMKDKMNLALAINAAADHYLTDAFSGGHIRIERDKMKAVKHWIVPSGDIGSLNLHDLDNENGVKVQNERGDKWTAYGDGRFALPQNHENRKYAKEAVRNSKQDIFDAERIKREYLIPKSFISESLVPFPIPNENREPKLHNKILGTGQRIGSVLSGIKQSEISDDNAVLDWLNHNPPAALARSSYLEKKRMINHLMSGVVGAEEVDAIERIYKSATSSKEITRIQQLVKPQTDGIRDIYQRTRLRAIISKNP